jgi:hypothetical protein
MDYNGAGNLQGEKDIDYEAIKGLIIQALEAEKLYLNAELDIKELSRHINMPVLLFWRLLIVAFK